MFFKLLAKYDKLSTLVNAFNRDKLQYAIQSLRESITAFLGILKPKDSISLLEQMKSIENRIASIAFE